MLITLSTLHEADISKTIDLLAHTTGLIIGNGLPQFCIGVHDKRAPSSYRLLDWLPVQYHELHNLCPAFQSDRVALSAENSYLG